MLVFFPILLIPTHSNIIPSLPNISVICLVQNRSMAFILHVMSFFIIVERSLDKEFGERVRSYHCIKASLFLCHEFMTTQS